MAVSATAITGIHLRNVSADSNDRFGVILNNDLGDQTAAEANYDYTYTIIYTAPFDGSGGGGGSGGGAPALSWTDVFPFDSTPSDIGSSLIGLNATYMEPAEGVNAYYQTMGLTGSRLRELLNESVIFSKSELSQCEGGIPFLMDLGMNLGPVYALNFFSKHVCNPSKSMVHQQGGAGTDTQCSNAGSQFSQLGLSTPSTASDCRRNDDVYNVLGDTGITKLEFTKLGGHTSMT